MALHEYDLTNKELAEKLHVPSLHERYPDVITQNAKGIEQVDLPAVAEYAQSYAESLRGVEKPGRSIIVDRGGYSFKFRADRNIGQYEFYLKDRANPNNSAWQMEGVVVRIPNPKFTDLSIHTREPSGFIKRTPFDQGLLSPELSRHQQIYLAEFLNRIKVPQRLLYEV